MLRALPALCLTLLCLIPASADNWPHWRGENGNSVSSTATPPTEWSPTKNIKWKVKLPGRGSGSPVIWEDRVFVTSAVPTAAETAQQRTPAIQLAALPLQPPRGQQRPGQRDRSRGGRGGRGNTLLPTLEFRVFCFDRSTGELIWEKLATVAKPHEGTHSTNGFASASPCTDGECVYAHFGSRGLFCYSMDGELQWKREDFGPMTTRATFGEGSSPTIIGDRIIVPWDHEGPSALYALNKKTGETLWKTNRDEPTCWATPLIIEHDGQQQIVMNGQNSARGYDLSSGEELWRCGGQTERPVACAVADGGLVFVGSGFRGSFLGAFRPDGSGDIAGTKNVVWSVNRDTPDIASPLLSEGRLYFHKGKTGVVSCLDAATGKTLFGPSRVAGLASIYASPVAAGGHVYLTGRSGTTVVLKDADTFQIVSTNSVGETVDATPAPVDSELFIRGEQHLFCIAEK